MPSSAVNSMAANDKEVADGAASLPMRDDGFKDITEQFRKAASELELGAMVRGERFGLIDAMNAIEIMDPKTDAHCAANQVKRRILSFSKAVEAGLKVKDFSIKELLGIMDELFACLATWLEGRNLAQSVFTCYYVHDITAIEDPILKAFCVGVLKCCWCFRHVLCATGVHEDEDQQTMPFGFSFLDKEVTDQRAAGMLKEVENDLNRQLRAMQNPSPTKPAAEVRSVMSEKLEDVQALLVRVRIMKQLLSFLIHIEKPKLAGVESALKSLQSITTALPLMKESLSIGIQKCAGPPVQALMLGFEPLVNQRALPPSPRVPRIMAREQAVDYLITMSKELHDVVMSTQLPTLAAILEFVWNFSWRRPFPTVLARSYLLHLVWDQNRIENGIREHARNFCAPPCINSKTNLSAKPDVRTLVDEFFRCAGQAFAEMMQLICMQRSWHRQKSLATFSKLAQLQDQSEHLDLSFTETLSTTDPEYHHNGYLSTWLLSFVLRLMVHYVLLGFELDLYQTSEYHYIYWYCDYLLGWVSGCMQGAEKVRKQAELAGLKGSKKTKKMKKVDKDREAGLLLVQAKQAMSRGMMRIIESCHISGKMSKPEHEYGSERSRFEHRFHTVFAALERPQVLTYEQYTNHVDIKHVVGQEPSTVLKYSLELFSQAKLNLEKVEKVMPEDPEVALLLKVAKTNAVVVKLMAGGHKLSSKEPPEFDFSVHRYFPIVRLR